MPSRRPNSRPLRLGLFERLEPRLPLVADITTGLVHHWTFDETSGDTANDSAGDSDGALVNWTPTEPKWEPGRVGGALRFATSDNYVIAPQPGMTGSFSIAFWLNAGTRDGRYARITTPKAGNVVFLAHEDGRGLSYSQNDDFYTFSSDPPTFNAWEHYVVNFNHATGQGVIFRSGAPIAIGAFADSASAQSWVIGHHYDLSNGDQSLHGALDDLRVYNRLLKDEDIAQLASLGTPEPTHVEPIHHWTFDETTGFTANDIAGDADGTLVNWNQTEPRWEPGKIGGALRFSTVDNAVVTAPASVGATWSVAFWANMTARDSLNPRVIGPDDGRELWAYFDNENNAGGAFMSHEIRTYEATPPPLNTWQHYVFTYDTNANIGNIYHNGRLVASGVFHDNPIRQAWVFGHNRDLGNHNESLNGLLDDLRVYDRILATSEIQTLALVAVNDTYTSNEDILLDIAAAQGLLANDTNAAPGSKTTVESDPDHGELDLNEDGSFIYDPDDDYNGPDGFTYRLTDPQGNFLFATVALTINPINDAPSFVVGGDRFVNDESGSRQITHWASLVTAGLADEAGQTLTFECTADKPELLAVQAKVVLVDGVWGKLTYSLKRNETGVVTVTVVLKDNGGTANGGLDTSPPQTFKINIAKAHPAHNAVTALDVDGDTAIAASDALDVINFLNAYGSQPVSSVPGSIPPYHDVDADGTIAAADALEVINYLNSSQPGSATFDQTDTTTQGNWLSTYGAEGYALNSGPTNLPTYAQLSFTGHYDVVWAASTSDPRPAKTLRVRLPRLQLDRPQ